jgi:antitoxin component of MazEF toxin-antitoxin module
MVYVQQLNNGVLYAVIPSKTAQAMNIKKGDEVAFTVDNPECARFRVLR